MNMMRGMTELGRTRHNLACAERTARNRAYHLVILYSVAFGALVVYLAMRFL